MEPIQIYVSCSMKADKEVVNQIKQKINQLGAVPTFWTVGTNYNDNKLRKSDAVVVISSNLKWNEGSADLTEGIRKEMLLATQLQKPLYKAYISGEGLGIYCARVTEVNGDKVFHGQTGTREYLRKFIEQLKEERTAHLFVDENHKALEKACKSRGFDFLSAIEQQALQSYRKQIRDNTPFADKITIKQIEPSISGRMVCSNGLSMQNIPRIPSNSQLEQMFPFIPKEEIETVLLLLR